MPNYAYCCSQCGLVYEEIRRISEMDAPMMCGKCGQSCERILFPGTANVRDLKHAKHNRGKTSSGAPGKNPFNISNSSFSYCGGAGIKVGPNVDLKLKNVHFEGNLGGGVVRDSPKK